MTHIRIRSRTDLLYISNTESDLFLHTKDRQYYLLVAGRWFRTKQLTGPWSAATLDLPDKRQSYGNKEHGLGRFSNPGKWFSLKMVIDTVQRNVIGYLRSDSGRWVQLNETPMPYYDSQADGTDLLVGFGTYKRGTAKNNILEMDNIRVTQLSYQSLN